MSDHPDKLPPKREVARALLVRGSVFVHLDPRHEDVVVPPWLAERSQLVLQVGLDMPVPIPDLRIDDQGVFATLSFNRAPYRCEVPWDAVFALVGEDAKGMVWPGALPDELAAEVEREARRRSRRSDAAPDAPPSPRPTIPPPPAAAPLDALRAATYPDPGDGDLPADALAAPGDDAAPADRPSLRVVPGGADTSSSRPPAPSNPPGVGRSRPPYLRVVK